MAGKGVTALGEMRAATREFIVQKSYFNLQSLYYLERVKGKAISLQAYSGPEGSRKLR
jgi:hypothetical protein